MPASSSITPEQYFSGTESSHYSDVTDNDFSEASSEMLGPFLPRFLTIDTDPETKDEMYLTLVNAWNLLAPGGIMALDDVEWNHRARPGVYSVKNGLKDFFKRHVQSLHEDWAELDPGTFTDYPPARVYPYVAGEKQPFINEGGTPPTLTGTIQPILEFHELWGSAVGKWIAVIRKDITASLTFTSTLPD